MPLSDDLLDIEIKYDCPRCSHPIVRKGSWFKVISGFECAKCKSRVPIGYLDKLTIFEKNHPKKRRGHADTTKG